MKMLNNIDFHNLLSLSCCKDISSRGRARGRVIMTKIEGDPLERGGTESRNDTRTEIFMGTFLMFIHVLLALLDFCCSYFIR